MIIVADEQIIGIEQWLHTHRIIKIPAQAMNAKFLKQERAEVLLVRSVTKVNAKLLEGTLVKWVGTLTSGTDHLDLPWLAAAGIHWASTPGANAKAVVEYVLSCIAALQLQNLLPRQQVRAGIIGVGVIGSKVVQALQAIGFQTLMNDPPRAAMEKPEQLNPFVSVPLNDFNDLDLICIHAELTRSGPYPSYHLLDQAFFKQQKQGCVLINVARGEIVATDVLLESEHLSLCLDVWEQEPFIDTKLLQRAVIATPHIAGYSLQAKQNAVSMICKKLSLYFSQNLTAEENLYQDEMITPNEKSEEINLTQNWQLLVAQEFDLLYHTQVMKKCLTNVSFDERGKQFERLRLSFAKRKPILNLSSL